MSAVKPLSRKEAETPHVMPDTVSTAPLIDVRLEIHRSLSEVEREVQIRAGSRRDSFSKFRLARDLAKSCWKRARRLARDHHRARRAAQYIIPVAVRDQLNGLCTSVDLARLRALRLQRSIACTGGFSTAERCSFRSAMATDRATVALRDRLAVRSDQPRENAGSSGRAVQSNSRAVVSPTPQRRVRDPARQRLGNIL